ncbi:MAG: site-specific integrase [Solirubrobacteraceae bacterium]
MQALRWDDIDLSAGVIRVARSWDAYEGEVSPKSRAGTRRVPIPSGLRAELQRHGQHLPRYRLAFGRSDEQAFSAKGIGARAQRLWLAAGLRPIGLHQCRHTYATFMIAAGVNIKALQTFMGHASITVTLDRYGHLLPGSENQAADLLDAYLHDERQP